MIDLHSIVYHKTHLKNYYYLYFPRLRGVCSLTLCELLRFFPELVLACLSNVLPISALVYRSADISWVLTWISSAVFFPSWSTCYRTIWYSISTCLLRLWYTGFLSKSSALWLSKKNGVGSHWVNPNFPQHLPKPHYLLHPRIHVWYSACILEVKRVVCSLDCYALGPPAANATKLWSNHLVIIYPT
jgi:hypothetical protein